MKVVDPHLLTLKRKQLSSSSSLFFELQAFLEKLHLFLGFFLVQLLWVGQH